MEANEGPFSPSLPGVQAQGPTEGSPGSLGRGGIFAGGLGPIWGLPGVSSAKWIPPEGISGAAHPHFWARESQKAPPPQAPRSLGDQEHGHRGEDGAGAQRCETETPAGGAVGGACPARASAARDGSGVANLPSDLNGSEHGVPRVPV